MDDLISDDWSRIGDGASGRQTSKRCKLGKYTTKRIVAVELVDAWSGWREQSALGLSETPAASRCTLCHVEASNARDEFCMQHANCMQTQTLNCLL